MRGYGPEAPWRLREDVIFLNHGVFGACPVPVLERQRALLDELEAGPVAFLDGTIGARVDAARAAVAAFLGADPDGLVFVPNATTGVSTVLRSLTFKPGDELLATNHEYNATLNALSEVARASGARVVTVRLALEVESAGQVTKAILAAVTPRTRLALVSHVTSPTATIFPIAEIVRELDARGVDTLVDAAHAPGMVPLDVGALGAAYWTGNGHKWLCGPKSSGMLAVRADRRDRIRPLIISHGWNDPDPGRPRLWKEFDWVGTVDPTPFLTLPTAIDVVGRLDPGGWPGLLAANHVLVLDARERIAQALGVRLRTPAALIGSMAIVPLPMDADDRAAEALRSVLVNEDRIDVSIMAWPFRAARLSPTDPPDAIVVRVSAQRYNEPADYDRLSAALARRLG